MPKPQYTSTSTPTADRNVEPHPNTGVSYYMGASPGNKAEAEGEAEEKGKRIIMTLGPNTSMPSQHQTNASSELMFVHAKMAGEKERLARA